MCLPLRPLTTSGVIWMSYDWLNWFYSFYMGAVVNIFSRHRLSINARHRNQPDRGKLVVHA